MGNMLHTYTDGLGHARNAQALRNGQERFETARELPEGADVDALTDDVIEVIGRACRAMPNSAACADLLREAGRMLQALADEVEAA